MTDISVPLTFTDAAAQKVKSLISEEENPDLKLRVYITGGGCSGFQYGFTFDEKVNDGDLTVENSGVQLVIFNRWHRRLHRGLGRFALCRQ